MKLSEKYLEKLFSFLIAIPHAGTTGKKAIHSEQDIKTYGEICEYEGKLEAYRKCFDITGHPDNELINEKIDWLKSKLEKIKQNEKL